MIMADMRRERPTPSHHQRLKSFVDRRTLLMAGGMGLAQGLAADRVRAESAARPSGKSVIMVWLSGGASHIDTWDMKPRAAREYRGPFEPISTSAPGVDLCEHLPLLARQMHHLAVVRSLGHFRRGTGDHHAGYYYNLTGHAPDPSFRQLLNNRKPRADDWPFFGTVVGYKSPRHGQLPQVVTLPQKPGAPQYTRPGQFAARLGVEHDPLYVDGDPDHPTRFTAPSLSLQGDVSAGRLQSRRALLTTLDSARRAFEANASTANYNTHQHKAFSLLGSDTVRDVFDVAAEPKQVRQRYGECVNGMSMLLARRLVEAHVPCVAVFWKGNKKLAEANSCKSGGGWDTHGNNFGCLSQVLLPEFDRCFSALIEDLSQRGLLESTVVVVNSEMGRKPKIGDPRSGGVKGAGRDHWTHCMSALLAGGGIRGGQSYGFSDPVGAYPADRPVAPEDITHTIYHALGFEELVAIDSQNRPLRLLDEGRPILELF